MHTQLIMIYYYDLKNKFPLRFFTNNTNSLKKVTHTDKVLSGEVVGLVLDVQRVEPLKKGMVQTKMKICLGPYGIG